MGSMVDVAFLGIGPQMTGSTWPQVTSELGGGGHLQAWPLAPKGM